MTDSLLLFTFSPIQPFIIEARRAAEMYTGSRILVELAKAAAEKIGKNRLIYPALLPNGNLPDDIPNKIVARVPINDCRAIAEAARDALLSCWQEQICDTAKADFLKRFSPQVDRTWHDIWERQTQWDHQTGKNYLWEIYWAAVELPNDESYKDAYERAEKALSAVKRARPFIPNDEPGIKDSLSGYRQALRTANRDARGYWSDVIGFGHVTPAKLRSGERLDAIGVVKRFSQLADHPMDNFKGFPSTSSVASADYLHLALENAPSQLAAYRDALRTILPGNRFDVRNDLDWPFDGDLLFRDTLTVKRLSDDYQTSITERQLEKPIEALGELYGKIKRPSTYYAILALDGDSMGKRVSQCKSEGEHKALSRKLTAFATSVPDIAKKHHAYIIYNGGDDVLAMAPLSMAFEFTRELTSEFRKTGGTASAGLAISHHQSPLAAALRAARRAESSAKRVLGKAAVCVTAIKRSGETMEMLSAWQDEDCTLDELVRNFTGNPARLSSKLAYELHGEALTAAGLPVPAREALIRRLVRRHKDKQIPDVDAEAIVQRLHCWSKLLDGRVPKVKALDGSETPQGLVEMSKWLLFARFVAERGGGE